MRFNLLNREPAVRPSLNFTGSGEQQAIWRSLENTSHHMIVNAVAGSGKTTTALRGCQHIPGAFYLAFNKSVQQEVDATGLVPARTFHSIGLEAIRANYAGVQTNIKRGWSIVNAVVPAMSDDSELCIAPAVKQLSSICKQYGCTDPDEMSDLIDTHEVDCGVHEQRVIGYTVDAMIASLENLSSVDFDDMIWVPFAKQLGMPRKEMLVVDELQDLNRVQQWLALQSGNRILGVGDPNQSIYGFRGADSSSMDNFSSALGDLWKRSQQRNVVTMPLSFTRRCAKSIIRAAQQVVPAIQALPDAIEGSCLVSGPNSWQSVIVGDLILCRTNAPLVSAAYQLLKAGLPACVIGREIGAGIANLLARAQKQSKHTDLKRILDVAGDIICDEFMKFSAAKQMGRANACQERLDCLIAAAKECASVKEVVMRLAQLSANDPRTSIRLSTIHRAKGLEADRVYLLRPELLPHPMASSDSQLQSERNLLYVAITRARHSLVFCGSLPQWISL
jgi:DNA helicase-2/ATP-dependent DNA helicase PcrA